MNIYFSANHRNIERTISLYAQITKVIQTHGHVLVNDWQEAALSKWPKQRSYSDWTSICIEARSGVEAADLIIAEATGESGFGVGFEVATALALKKPILILVKNGEGTNSYASGLDRAKVSYKEYKPGDLTRAILAFIENVEISK